MDKNSNTARIDKPELPSLTRCEEKKNQHKSACPCVCACVCVREREIRFVQLEFQDLDIRKLKPCARSWNYHHHCHMSNDLLNKRRRTDKAERERERVRESAWVSETFTRSITHTHTLKLIPCKLFPILNHLFLLAKVNMVFFWKYRQVNSREGKKDFAFRERLQRRTRPSQSMGLFGWWWKAQIPPYGLFI